MARHLAAHDSPVAAYLHAYEPKTANRASLRNTAYRLANHPKVRARVAVLTAAAAERSVTTNADLMAALEEVVEVDANELVAVVVSPCRYCHGIDHQWQWQSPAEYALAVAKAIDSGETIPNDAGGYAFTLDREPHGECPRCHGAGDARVHFSSTAEASRGARRLLKGVELYPDGRLKRLHLHDQTALRVELHKLRGMHVDRSVSLNVSTNIPDFAEIANDPAKALDFLESIRPTKPPATEREPVTINATAETSE